MSKFKDEDFIYVHSTERKEPLLISGFIANKGIGYIAHAFNLSIESIDYIGTQCVVNGLYAYMVKWGDLNYYGEPREQQPFIVLANDDIQAKDIAEFVMNSYNPAYEYNIAEISDEAELIVEEMYTPENYQEENEKEQLGD